jgi:hypothetical protein
LSKKAWLKARTPSLQWALNFVTSLPEQGDQIMAVILTSRYHDQVRESCPSLQVSPYAIRPGFLICGWCSLESLLVWGNLLVWLKQAMFRRKNEPLIGDCLGILALRFE